MTYHVRQRGVGDVPPVVSTGPSGVGPSIISPASVMATWSQARQPLVTADMARSPGTVAQIAQISARLPAEIAAMNAACASFTDPVANTHCMEAAQALRGPDLIRNVQAKLDCDDLINNQGVLTDDQRIDCVDCAYNKHVPKSQLAAAVLQLEVDRAYAAGLTQQKFFAKHKVAIFAVGGSVVALGLAAVILRRKRTVQAQATKNRRRSA